MKGRLLAALKAPLLFTAIFGLGLSAGGPVGGLFDRLLPSAEASPGNGNGYGGQCNYHSLQGKFGFYLNGTVLGVGELTSVGAEMCDGQGNCSGHATINIGGMVVEDSFTAVDTISPDCTGTGVVSYTSGFTAHVAFVVIGDDIHFMSTDPDSVLSGTQTRR